jgi:hypothetical protein
LGEGGKEGANKGNKFLKTWRKREESKGEERKPKKKN